MYVRKRYGHFVSWWTNRNFIFFSWTDWICADLLELIATPFCGAHHTQMRNYFHQLLNLSIGPIRIMAWKSLQARSCKLNYVKKNKLKKKKKEEEKKFRVVYQLANVGAIARAPIISFFNSHFNRIQFNISRFYSYLQIDLSPFIFIIFYILIVFTCIFLYWCFIIYVMILFSFSIWFFIVKSKNNTKKSKRHNSNDNEQQNKCVLIS